MDTYTDEELRILQGIINEHLIISNNREQWPLSSVKEWIGNDGYYQKIKYILAMPYDQLPLYINDIRHSTVIITKWRLRIGR